MRQLNDRSIVAYLTNRPKGNLPSVHHKDRTLGRCKPPKDEFTVGKDRVMCPFICDVFTMYLA